MPTEIKEGWGITKYFDEKDQKMYFLVTDGTSNLHTVDVETFKVLKTIKVFKQINDKKFE